MELNAPKEVKFRKICAACYLIYLQADARREGRPCNETEASLEDKARNINRSEYNRSRGACYKRLVEESKAKKAEGLTWGQVAIWKKTELKARLGGFIASSRRLATRTSLPP